MKHSMDTSPRQLAPKDYPPQLREIPGMPASLWLRGALPPVETKHLAVVGSRAITPYGMESTNTLIAGLAGHPISIVSGLALGVDACAHEAALTAGLHTIAVLASGISDEAIGPRANVPLARRILESGGALISENDLTYSPFPSDFPKRNRLVAGLADAVLVIEAGERSGTLITARLASEYNRELLCVPHRIGDTHGAASDIFVRLGAIPVTESKQILEALRISAVKVELPTLTEREQLVYDLLQEPLDKDDLIRATTLAPTEALTIILTLELKGILKEKYGLWRRV